MPLKFTLIATGMLLLFFAHGRRSCAVTVELDASRDNTIYSEGQLSNGSGPVFFAGKSGSEDYRRALIQFDVAGEIPAGATITSASLTLYMSKTQDPGNAIVELHRLQAEWGEGASAAGGGGPGQGGGSGAPAELGDATWTDRIYPDESWSTDGGDFDPNASASLLIGDVLGFYTWGSNALTVSDVQKWLDNPATNFGWLIQGNENYGQTARRFDSRENPVVSNRPLLTIEYESSGFTADFTNDGYVDGDDLAIWEAAYGVDDMGDTDEDSDTDGDDFLNWQRQYTGPPEVHVVPEPGCAALLLIAAALAMGGRYRL
jgi:hypothetical protein